MTGVAHTHGASRGLPHAKAACTDHWYVNHHVLALSAQLYLAISSTDDQRYRRVRHDAMDRITVSLALLESVADKLFPILFQYLAG